MQSTVAAPLTPERLLFRLDWKVLRRLDGLLQGDYRTHFRGVGVDFADLREYQPDDDAQPAIQTSDVFHDFSPG